ncbi:MAG: hypothetical protein ACK52I_15595 [Pseudomonadota bacterium]|jgi:hypothetical protein
MIIKDGETIVTAFAENARKNKPIWVIVRGADFKLREECIQPENQTADMIALFNVSSAAHESMTSVETFYYRTPKK